MQTLTAPVLYIRVLRNIDNYGDPRALAVPRTSDAGTQRCAPAAPRATAHWRRRPCRSPTAPSAARRRRLYHRLAAQFPGNARRWRYPCGPRLTVAVTHPRQRARSFLSNYGHIARLSTDDILTQLPTRATPGDVLLCGTFLYRALLPDYPRLLTTLRDRGFQWSWKQPFTWWLTRCVGEPTAGWAIATGCCSMR